MGKNKQRPKTQPAAEAIKLEPSEHNSPRPHPLTVRLSGGAIVVSVLALVVSARACDTAKDSLRIGQQPYLSIRSVIFTVRTMGALKRPGGVKPADNSPPVVIGNNIDTRQAQGDLAIYYEFEIENSGNTPAIPIELSLTFKMPEGWGLAVPWTDFRGGLRITNGSRRASIPIDAISRTKPVRRAVTIGLDLTEDARFEFLTKRAETSINGIPIAGFRGPVELSGALQYRDEIGLREPLTWCTVVQMHQPTPLDCITGAISLFTLK